MKDKNIARVSSMTHMLECHCVHNKSGNKTSVKTVDEKLEKNVYNYE